MYSIVYTTTGNEADAKMIASELVKQKLAACVNMHPVDSVYLWEGKIENEREIALSIKTMSNKVGEVTECIKKLHSYDLPAIISWEIKGEKQYLEWISESTEK
ncbi:MAG: divalent-cation tolerance protein CutA [Methanolobus sp.]